MAVGKPRTFRSCVVADASHGYAATNRKLGSSVGVKYERRSVNERELGKSTSAGASGLCGVAGIRSVALLQCTDTRRSSFSQHNMIQHIDTKGLARIGQSLRYLMILAARRGITGWMIVYENNRGCGIFYCRSIDLAWMDQAAVERPDGDLVRADDLVLGVERYDVEFFLFRITRQSCKVFLEKCYHIVAAADLGCNLFVRNC